MSRSYRDQKNWKLIQIHREADKVFRLNKSSRNAFSHYTDKVQELVINDPSIDFYELNQTPDKNHNERKSKARLKVVSRRIDKRSDRNKFRKQILEEI